MKQPKQGGDTLGGKKAVNPSGPLSIKGLTRQKSRQEPVREGVNCAIIDLPIYFGPVNLYVHKY